MVRVRWRKVLLDLKSNLARTTLVVAAIAVGVFAVGFVASAQQILLRELNRDYLSTNPAAAVLYTAPFDDVLVDSVASIPQVAAAEGRRSTRVRVQVAPEQWETLVLTAVGDFDDMRLDKVQPVAGSSDPARQEMLVEFLSRDYLNADLGDRVTVELDDGSLRELAVVGFVHDGRVPNAEIVDSAFGFVTPETFEWLGLGRQYTEMRFTVAENGADADHIRAVTAVVEDKLEKSGAAVASINVPKPGEHWAEEIIETLVLLIGVLGILILFLSGFLVVNTISALISQHVRQIGVMKLVGARRRQIMSMYFVTVAAYGLLALAVGVPTSIIAAQFVVQRFVADLLNFRVVDQSVSASILGMQLVVGLVVPLMAAAWPVVRGVQVTTHAALNSTGISQGYGRGLIERVFVRLQDALPVQRPLIISLRNTVRRKGRLLLTLATLVMATALFISVLSVRDSVQLTLDNFLQYHQYDVRVDVKRSYRTSQLEQVALSVPGVAAAEIWTADGTRRVFADGTDSDNINLLAVPPDTRLMKPALEAGRWLRSDDQNALVVNADFAEAHPDVGLGDTVTLDVNGRELAWQIVGQVRGLANGPGVYVSDAYYAYATRSIGRGNTVRVVSDQRAVGAGAPDTTVQKELATALTQAYQDAGIRLNRTQTTGALRARLDFQFNVVVNFLVLFAVLLAVVGGLGLTTTMSINVLERIREIGVLRAIGASDWSVRLIVLSEGVLVGWLSFVLGALLALPFSRLLSQQVGLALLGSPLSYAFSTSGMLMWFVIISCLGAAASLGPAQSASRLTIREVLAYE